MREIYLAGGCFWGLQRAMDRVPGVTATEVGYANGPDRGPAPTYEEVRANSGHAETVRVQFDERAVALGEVLDQYFAYLTSTGIGWQAGGFGSQYRHAVLYTDESQLAELNAALARARDRGGAPAAAEVEPLRNFFRAEARHQAHPKDEPLACDRNSCVQCTRP